jgi:hypothetical protein
MSIDWHYWHDDPPPPMKPIEACYSLEKGDWMPGHMCKRHCCFRNTFINENLVIPNFWRLPTGPTGDLK